MSWERGKFSKIKVLNSKFLKLSELLQLELVKKKENLERISMGTTKVNGKSTK